MKGEVQSREDIGAVWKGNENPLQGRSTEVQFSGPPAKIHVPILIHFSAGNGRNQGQS